MKPIYRHLQPSWFLRVLLTGVGLCQVWIFARLDMPWVGLALGLAMVALAFVAHGLHVSLDRDGIRVAFGVGFIRRRISWREVVSFQRVRNSWLHGWGFRLLPNGWMWNVSGLDAVELQFEGGRVFRVGTDEPEALCEAIAAAAPDLERRSGETGPPNHGTGPMLVIVAVVFVMLLGAVATV